MAGIGLAGEASIEEAEAALEVWRSVALPRQTMARETRSIEGIEEDIASFAAGVGAVVAAAAPALSRASPAESLAELAANLAQARRAEDARKRLRQAMAKRAGVRRGLLARRELFARTLADAGLRLGIADPAALAPALDRHERRRRAASRSASGCGATSRKSPTGSTKRPCAPSMRTSTFPCCRAGSSCCGSARASCCKR